MPYVFRQTDLPKLDIQVDRGSDFQAWKDQWTSYCTLSGLAEESAATKVQVLTLCLSRETLAIVNNLGLTTEQKQDSDAIITAIKRHIDGHINESVERRNLRRRAQQPGETFDDYLVSLRELAKTCGFCSEQCTQKSIRDQIIEGSLDGDVIEELLKQPNLTLDNTIAIARAQEAAKKQRNEMTSASPGAVLAVKNRRQQPPTQQPAVCPGCGSKPHVGGRARCPAYEQICHHCNKPGHFARVCRAKKSTTLRPPPSAKSIQTTWPEEPRQHHLDTITQISATDPAPTIRVHLQSVNGTCDTLVLPDSGADISAAGPHLLKLLHEHPLNLLTSEVAPRTADGHSMEPIGKFPVTFHLQGRLHREDMHIYPQVSGVIMSWKAAKSLCILPSQYPQPIPVFSPSVAPISDVNTLATKPDANAVIGKYPSVFDGQIRTMQGEEFRICLAANAKPFCVHTPRTIPFAYQEKLKAELDLLESQNVIAPITEATTWCAPIVVTPKKNSQNIRMCVDLSHLNRFVIRERYQSLTPAQAVADIATSDAKIFTILDALKGYHQCPLDKDSQTLTTFITPFGRYKYLRAPYGISSISEHYNRRMTEAFNGLSGFRRIVDDFVIYDSNIADHLTHVEQFLQRCAENNIALNMEKCQFFKSEVTFAGFQLSSRGYKVDPSITEAITRYPIPANRTDLRSFMGLVNQLSTSTHTLASLLTPFRPLLSTKNEFVWSSHHQEAFAKVKTSLTTSPLLSFFDMTKPTRLSTDASRQGLGFVLQQQTGGEWTLVQAGSRFLSDAETRYAVIELEMLAVCWAITKCRLFLAGLQHFTVYTDHNPLIPILNTRRLDEIENPRLQRLKSRLMGYHFTTQWTKGSSHSAPDALSRNPVSTPVMDDSLAEYDSQQSPEASIAEIRALSSVEPLPTTRLQELNDNAANDPDYQQLRDIILNGFPDHRHQLPESCRRFWNVREHLSIDEGLIVHGCRLLIPTAMRQKILSDLHASHQGAVRTKQRARLTVYWPGIDNDIDNIVLSCQQCQDHLPAHPKEPLVQKPKPLRPFQELAVDFCSYGGQQFLILVDCCTDWPEIIPMGHNTTTHKLVSALRQSFCRTAVPDILWSDQGPQFTAHAFRNFARQWGFTHNTSSPRYPQSNGKVEATVKSMKKLLATSWERRCVNEDKLCRALLQYRNTPCRKDNTSPAQKLFGHPIQDTLPAHRRSFAPEWQKNYLDAEQQATDTLAKSRQFYNTHAHSLPEIQIGSPVALQNQQSKLWDIYGTVITTGPNRRYFVKTRSGRILVRNRRFLRRRTPASLLPPSLPQDGVTGHPQAQPLPPSQAPDDIQLSQPPNEVRRSTRPRRPPTRLIEDPLWHK